MEPTIEETTELIPCVTEKYIYIRVLEMYSNQKTRVNVTDTGNGTTWGEPSWGELVVGIVRVGKGDLKEELRLGTISVSEYFDLKETLRNFEYTSKFDNSAF